MRKRPAVSAGVLGAAGPAGAAGSAAPITPADPSTPASLALLVDLTGLSEQLCRSLAAGDWTNAFLAAGGMNQIAEDYLSGASALASPTLAACRGLGCRSSTISGGRSKSPSPQKAQA